MGAADVGGMHKPAYKRESGTVDTDQYLVLHSPATATKGLGNTQRLTWQRRDAMLLQESQVGQQRLFHLCVYMGNQKNHTKLTETENGEMVARGRSGG